MGGHGLLRARTQGRMQWMDALRGGAIVLVLLWHAPAVPALFDWPMPAWLRGANDFFWPYRMPTLMFLSGLLLPRALGKGTRNYLLGKVQMLVWPYVLWCLIYFAQYGAPAPLYVWRVWYATGYLWFLCFITIYYVAAPLVTRLPPWLTPLLCVAASLAVPTSVEVRLLYFAAFFFLGHWFATDPRLLTVLRRPWVVAAMAVVAVGFGAVSVLGGAALAYRAEFVPFSLAGILVLCWLASHVRGRALTVLAFLGRHSLIYYVAHFPVMTLVVFAHQRWGAADSPFIWVWTLLAALLVCTWLARHRDAPAVSWLFRMPDPLIAWARDARQPVSAVPAPAGPALPAPDSPQEGRAP